MTRVIHEELPKPDRSVNRRLAYGVFAPPAAWFISEVAGVALAGRHCGSALGSWGWIAMIGVSLLAIAVTASAAWIAYGVFRDWTRGGSPTEAEGLDRVEFVSLLGVFLSCLLLANIVFFAVMPFVVDPCLRTI